MAKKYGLMVIAHGAPMAEWNAPVLALQAQIETALAKRGDHPFSSVKVALMEFNEPSVHTQAQTFEAEGVDHVFALPLFIAPSGHSMFDVPAILGLYADSKTLAHLKAEGTKIVDSKMQLTVGSTINQSPVLKASILDRVNELSSDAENEAVILLAHGDSQFQSNWETMCRDIGQYVSAKTGIEYFDFALVGMGASFATDAVGKIMKANQSKQRVIVVGAYMSSGVERMANSSVSFMHGKQVETKTLFEGKDIQFASRGILPDSRVADWITDTAMDWVDSQ